MKTAAVVLRIVFGLHFLVNGLNFYLNLFPINIKFEPAAQQFIDTVTNSGLIEVVKVVEVAVGVALLANVFVPLAAVIAMPVSVGVAYMDIFLVGGWLVGGVLGVGTLLLNAALLLVYFRYYRPFLSLRSTPGFS